MTGDVHLTDLIHTLLESRCFFVVLNGKKSRWNGTRLSNTTTPVYLQGVHLDRTLCYKTHIEKTKMKVNARNNIIRKLVNSKWGARHRHSDPAVSPSATQLLNTPALCGQGLHARKLNPALQDCNRIISGCLKPTNLDSVHILAGIAPPHIRRTVAFCMEPTRQTPDTNCSITNQLLADCSRGRASCAQSRRSTFLRAAADCGSGKIA